MSGKKRYTTFSDLHEGIKKALRDGDQEEIYKLESKLEEVAVLKTRASFDSVMLAVEYRLLSVAKKGSSMVIEFSYSCFNRVKTDSIELSIDIFTGKIETTGIHHSFKQGEWFAQWLTTDTWENKYLCEYCGKEFNENHICGHDEMTQYVQKLRAENKRLKELL